MRIRSPRPLVASVCACAIVSTASAHVLPPLPSLPSGCTWKVRRTMIGMGGLLDPHALDDDRAPHVGRACLHALHAERAVSGNDRGGVVELGGAADRLVGHVDRHGL